MLPFSADSYHHEKLFCQNFIVNFFLIAGFTAFLYIKELKIFPIVREDILNYII